MNWITQIVKREVFKYRLKNAFKRYAPDIDAETLRMEIDTIMAFDYDEDDISWTAAELAASEAISYWHE